MSFIISVADICTKYVYFQSFLMPKMHFNYYFDFARGASCTSQGRLTGGEEVVTALSP